MLNLDHDTLLTLEVIALVLLVMLAFWRIARQRRLVDGSESEPGYDMRRDGPRLDM